MDFYLQSGNSYRRLENEFKKYGKLMTSIRKEEHMKMLFSYFVDGRIIQRLLSLQETAKINMQ